MKFPPITGAWLGEPEPAPRPRPPQTEGPGPRLACGSNMICVPPPERADAEREDVVGLLAIEGGVITAVGCDRRDDVVERHYARLRVALERALSELADACEEQVIVDLRAVPLRPERAVHMIIELDREAHSLGLRFALVATPETASLLRRVADTADIPVHDTVEEALAST